MKVLKNIDKKIIIISKNIDDTLVKKYKSEYSNIEFKNIDIFNNRFIIIDRKKLYSCGASFKDLGKKCFSINEMKSKELIKKIKRKVQIKMLNEYTKKEQLILEQYKNGPYYTLITYLTETEHLQFIKKLISGKNLYCIIFLTCIYTEYNQKFLIDYFIKYKDAYILADFLDSCNDFWEYLDQKYIVDGILALNDKRYVKDLLDTKRLYFLTNKSERKKLEDFIK